MSTFNPFSQYRDTRFSTADQGALILMSYDAAIRFCRSAKQAMADGEAELKGRMLTRAFDIVAELRKSLRHEVGGEVAKHLDEAYAFICNQITLANVLSDPERVANALQVLEDLREAWGRIIHEERRTTEAPAS